MQVEMQVGAAIYIYVRGKKTLCDFLASSRLCGEYSEAPLFTEALYVVNSSKKNL
jgi:hypothetical protein